MKVNPNPMIPEYSSFGIGSMSLLQKQIWCTTLWISQIGEDNLSSTNSWLQQQNAK